MLRRTFLTLLLLVSVTPAFAQQIDGVGGSALTVKETMRAWTLAVLLGLLVSLPVCAETVTWDCNTEPDMKEYRGERSADAGASWGVLFTKPHVPGCTQLSYQSTTYVKPGDKLGRLFACDKAGNCSGPSATVPYKIATPPVGNPGGQTETPLPPSPFGAVTPPPPPVVVKPGDVTGLAAGSLTQESAIITGNVPAGAKVNVRYMKAPLSWGSAVSASCESLPCTITGLTPDTLHEAQCIPYFGAMNQGAIYGNFCPTVTIKTLPAPVPPPDLEPRMKAIQDRLDGIEEMGAVLDAEMQEVRGTMRALCRALKGNCP